MRAIDLASHLKPDSPSVMTNEACLTGVPIHPGARSIISDDGTAISADFLYDNSLSIGWVDRTRGSNSQAWQPIKFDKAEIKVETWGAAVRSYLLLDGKPFPAVIISSASLGIHENTPWYHVPFPSDNGVCEPEWEEPQIVLDTLEQLVQMASDSIEHKTDVTMDITGFLQKTGRDLYSQSMSPSNAAIIARRFRKQVP